MRAGSFGHGLNLGAPASNRDRSRVVLLEVGPTGRVLVTDIEPRWLAPLERSNVEVRRHDTATDGSGADCGGR